MSEIFKFISRPILAKWGAAEVFKVILDLRKMEFTPILLGPGTHDIDLKYQIVFSGDLVVEGDFFVAWVQGLHKFKNVCDARRGGFPLATTGAEKLDHVYTGYGLELYTARNTSAGGDLFLLNKVDNSYKRLPLEAVLEHIIHCKKSVEGV